MMTGCRTLSHFSGGEVALGDESRPEDVFRQGSISVEDDAATVAARVLVVEDDQPLARFLDRTLRANRFAVELCHDGITALDAIGQARPAYDLVILDLNLPGLDGISVLKRLRPGSAGLAVLVLTARSRTGDMVLALESGADDCLTKPFSYVELLARVQALLRRRTAKPYFRAEPSRIADLVL